MYVFKMKRRSLDVREIPDSAYLIRFINNIDIDRNTGCWNWCGPIGKSGYGNFSVGTRQVSSHVYIMEKTNRHITGLYVDHVCQNRSCCNPDHLRMVTPRVNVIENNSSPAFVNANKTHCKYNHPFTKENTGRYTNGKTGKNSRVCLQCKRERRENAKKSYGYSN